MSLAIHTRRELFIHKTYCTSSLRCLCLHFFCNPTGLCLHSACIRSKNFCSGSGRDRVSLCISGGPETCFVDHAGFALIEILLSLPTDFWDKRLKPPYPVKQKYLLTQVCSLGLTCFHLKTERQENQQLLYLSPFSSHYSLYFPFPSFLSTHVSIFASLFLPPLLPHTYQFTKAVKFITCQRDLTKEHVENCSKATEDTWFSYLSLRHTQVTIKRKTM